MHFKAPQQWNIFKGNVQIKNKINIKMYIVQFFQTNPPTRAKIVFTNKKIKRSNTIFLSNPPDLCFLHSNPNKCSDVIFQR